MKKSDKEIAATRWAAKNRTVHRISHKTKDIFKCPPEVYMQVFVGACHALVFIAFLIPLNEFFCLIKKKGSEKLAAFLKRGGLLFKVISVMYHSVSSVYRLGCVCQDCRRY